MIHPKELNSGNRYFICSLVFTVELKGISARIVILAGFGGIFYLKERKTTGKEINLFYLEKQYFSKK